MNADILVDDAVGPSTFLVLLDDQPDNWDTVYTATCDCYCKLQMVMNRTLDSSMSGAWMTQDAQIQAGVPTHIGPVKFHEFLRPRFWYVSLVNCDKPTFTAQLNLQMTQGENMGNSQFSYDEKGLLSLYIVGFVVWFITSFVQLYNSRNLWRANSFHPIIKLFSGSMFFYTMFLLCMMVDFATFKSDGIGM